MLLGIVMLCAQLSAQQRTIIGKVTDANGSPVPNATVQIKGTKSGTTTQPDGSYSIIVTPQAKVLVFSGIGLAEMEIAIGNKGVINASLQSSDKSLQEVVVVGYGTQRKLEATGNISTIKGNVIAEKPVQSFENALAGKAPGVQVTMSNGLANNPPVFRIRGTNSISLSSYPLIIVDGVATYTGDQGNTSAPANPLASINPNDIESIDIAKDAAATAIYGSRAANGVVFITTKRGKAGRTKVSYDGWVGWSEAIRLPKLLDGFQYTDFKNAAIANLKANNAANTGSFSLTNGPDGKPINTNWFDYLYRTGFSQSHNVSVSGGSDNTNYYFATGYTRQQSYLRKNEFNRINVLFNVDSRVNKIITVGGKISYSNENNLVGGTSGGLPGEGFAIAGTGRIGLVLPSNISPYNNDGSYNIASGSAIGSMGDVLNGGGVVSYYNPVMVMNLNRSNNEVQHIQSNAYVQVKPLSWLTLKSTYGIDNLFIDNDVFYNPYHGDGASSSTGPAGAATDSYSKGKTWVWTSTAQLDYTFKEKHSISLLVGNEQQRRTSYGFGLNRKTLSDSAYTVIQAGYTTNNASNLSLGENYLLSSFARLTYNFNKKYFLSGNVRQDEYSALGVKKGTFYGASAGWEITREAFWTNAGLDKIFSGFKIRGSYGKVGNYNGLGNYPTYSTYSSGLYGGTSTLAFNAAGNTNIQWETSKKTDFGFNFGLFNDRITGEASYYYNNIDGLILNVPQAPSTGLPGGPVPTVLANSGTMYNKGIEIGINATVIAKKDFSWNSSFNISFNKNEVTSLANGLPEIINGLGGGTTEYVTKTVPGYSIGQIWVVRTAGVDPASGRRIFLNKAGQQVLYENGTVLPAGRFNWTNPDGTQYKKNGVAATITQADDAVLYSNTVPKGYGGWDNTVHYKNFDLNFLFTYQFGFHVYYGTNAGLHDMRFWNNSTDVLNYWKKAGDVTNIPKPVYNDNVSNGSAMPLDINVFKGDFIKLRTVQIGYNIPKSVLERVKLSSARFYVSGQNLAIITKYPGSDPEVSTDGNSNATQGIDRNTLPNARTITVGINIGL